MHQYRRRTVASGQAHMEAKTVPKLNVHGSENVRARAPTAKDRVNGTFPSRRCCTFSPHGAKLPGMTIGPGT